jgi:flagellar basal body-associated protein FliL
MTDQQQPTQGKKLWKIVIITMLILFVLLIVGIFVSEANKNPNVNVISENNTTTSNATEDKNDISGGAIVILILVFSAVVMALIYAMKNSPNAWSIMKDSETREKARKF